MTCRYATSWPREGGRGLMRRRRSWTATRPRGARRRPGRSPRARRLRSSPCCRGRRGPRCRPRSGGPRRRADARSTTAVAAPCSTALGRPAQVVGGEVRLPSFGRVPPGTAMLAALFTRMCGGPSHAAAKAATEPWPAVSGRPAWIRSFPIGSSIRAATFRPRLLVAYGRGGLGAHPREGTRRFGAQARGGAGDHRAGRTGRRLRRPRWWSRRRRTVW